MTEQFEMETQPQLLLLQKTMVLVEGVGRTLDPSVNMWQLARPLIEGWMRANRGPEARVRETVTGALSSLERLPRLMAQLEKSTSLLVDGRFRLHPDTLREIVGSRHDRRLPGWLPWLLAAGLRGAGHAVSAGRGGKWSMPRGVALTSFPAGLILQCNTQNAPGTRTIPAPAGERGLLGP